MGTDSEDAAPEDAGLNAKQVSGVGMRVRDRLRLVEEAGESTIVPEALQWAGDRLENDPEYVVVCASVGRGGIRGTLLGDGRGPMEKR